MDFHGLFFPGSPDAHLFNPHSKIIESGYDSAWPLYALALDLFHKKGEVPEIGAASKLTRCAFNLRKTWEEGSPLALYLSIMHAVQQVKITKEALIGIAQAHAPARFLALHLQLIPELAEFVDIERSLSALRKKDETSLLKVAELLRDHRYLSLVPREEIKKSSPRLLNVHTVKEEAESLFHYTRLLFFRSLTALKSSSNPKSLSPLSDLSNRLSYFASLYVLRGEDKTERTRRYRALIQLIDASIKMKNYHAATSLHHGLVRSELTRLTEFLPDEAHEALFSPHSRWEMMRKIKGPHIPYSALLSAELEIYVEGKEEALQSCIQSISRRFEQLFTKNFSYSTELPLIGETIGESSLEDLEKELYRLSSFYKPYPALRTYSVESNG